MTSDTTTVVVVHKFRMGDVEDPDLFAATPLIQFETSELGRWLMQNTNPKPSWHRVPRDYGWEYQIRAYLTEKQLTYYKLKYE